MREENPGWIDSTQVDTAKHRNSSDNWSLPGVFFTGKDAVGN